MSTLDGERRSPSAGDTVVRLRSDATLEEACTRLCGLAGRLVDAPAVLVSLCEGGRPYLMGARGLEQAPPGWSTSPLALSLTGHAGAQGEALSLEDVQGHELLSSDPLHHELGFRSFLALPLRVGDENLGSLCAMDRVPRQWTGADVEALAAVAESVVTEVRLRGSLRQIRAVESATSHAARQSFAALVDDLDAVVVERDLASRDYTFVSRKAEELLGYPVERWLDDPDFWSRTVVHPDDRKRVVREVEQGVREGRSLDLDYRARAADGTTLWMRDLVQVVTNDDGSPRLLRSVMVDVTDQRRAESSLRLLQQIAMVANEAETITEPLRLALRLISEHAGFPVAHVYWRDGERVVPSNLWYLADEDAYRPFVEATSEHTFETGKGLPGRVLESGRSAWIRDVAEDGWFPRREDATSAGLAAAFAFPVLTGRETLAVCEFFSEDILEPDGELLDLTAHVGTILGRIVERHQSQEELRMAELRARKTVETAHEAFISIDASGLVREWNGESERIFQWTREETIGRSLADLIVPQQHREAHRRGIERYLRTGEGQLVNRLFEIDGVRKDGSTVPVELSITPLELGDTILFNAFLRDISQRRRDEEERRRRERQLAQAQRLAHLGSWEWDLRTNDILWSDELHRIFGTDPDTFDPSFEAFVERIHPDDRDLVESVVGAAAETHEDFMFEHRVVRPDGSQRMVLGQGRVETDRDGLPLRMAGTAQDITDRKQLEEKERALATEQAARAEAEAAEKRITDILESITDAFFTIDRDWRFTYLNPEAERVIQQPADDLLGVELWAAFPEARGSTFEKRYREAMDSGGPVEFEEYYPPLGRWFEVRAFPSERGLSVYFHDITDRREAEARLRASEARYRFLSDSIPQHVWTARPDGTLDYVNRVAAEYLGRSSEELVEEGWLGVLHPEDVDRTIQTWARSLESGEPYENEFRLRAADGTYRWHLARARAQRTDDGGIIRWFGTNTDVHDQKQLEEDRDEAMDELERVTHVLSSERRHLEEQARELRRYARALKRSNEELDQFAYVASHDLKAPLRGIANLTQWLVDDLSASLTAETREYADLLQNRVHRMESLIDGILEYSRAGRKRHAPEDLDMVELVHEVLDMIGPPDHFEIEVPHWLPTLRAERVPLQQVLLNLIGNAVKHADGENPRVAVACSDEGEAFYEFSISDNGPGIDPEFHDRIWTIFQTLQPRDEVEGTGIGLSVVKRTVEGQGGQVWVESSPGEGATFKFLWPRTPPERSDVLER